MGTMLILVDGYNVIRNQPGLAAAERRSLAEGREALLSLVRARFGARPYRVYVVFDGSGPAESRQAIPGMPRGNVVFSPAGVTADSVIQQLAELERATGGAATEIVLCTNDLDLRARAMPAEATSTSTSSVDVATFSQALHRAPPGMRGLKKRAARAQYERQKAEAEANGLYAQRPKKGNPRRAPKRQRRQQERSRPPF